MGIFRLFGRIVKGTVLTSVVAGGTIAGMHLDYSALKRPKPISLNPDKNKRRNVVVVGTGIIGMTTAYFLS